MTVVDIHAHFEPRMFSVDKMRAQMAANGVDRESKKAKGWFRHDERIKALIDKDGVYGIPGLKPAE